MFPKTVKVAVPLPEIQFSKRWLFHSIVWQCCPFAALKDGSGHAQFAPKRLYPVSIWQQNHGMYQERDGIPRGTKDPLNHTETQKNFIKTL